MTLVNPVLEIQKLNCISIKAIIVDGQKYYGVSHHQNVQVYAINNT